jgi:hypothetical protein
MSIFTDKDNPYGGNLSHTITFIDSDSNTVDVTRLVLEFNIYESIFNQTLSADFVIRDSLGLIDTPMTGQEFVAITFSSNNDSLLGTSSNLTFKVHRVGNKTELNAGTSVYTLHCSSIELEQNLTKYVTNTYKDKLGHEAVSDIFTNFIDIQNGKGLVVEECENVVPYTPVGHNPFEAIDIIGKECRSKAYNDASHFLFYETTQGFNFRTLSGLLQQEPDASNVYYFSDPAVPGAYDVERTIIGHTFLDNVDTIDLLIKGLYENDVAVIDPLTKTYSEAGFNYALDFDKLPHIVAGGKPTINLSRTNVLASEIPGPAHSRLQVADLAKLKSSNNITFDSRITADNDPYVFHGRERFRKTPLIAAQLASIRQHGIDVTVPVNLNLNAGDIVQLYIPSNKDREGNDDPFIEHFGSNPTFLITSVTTKLTVNGDYVSILQCVKESFATDLSGVQIQFSDTDDVKSTLITKAIQYIGQETNEYGVTTDKNINLNAGTISTLVASAEGKALSVVTEKATSEVDKSLSDATAAAADPNAEGASDVVTDEATLSNSLDQTLDSASDDIAAQGQELAENAVENIKNAAVAAGVTLATTKVLSALNVSPAKMAKLIRIIALLEKIPIFKGPITDVKADAAALKDSASSAVTGGGE